MFRYIKNCKGKILGWESGISKLVTGMWQISNRNINVLVWQPNSGGEEF